MMFAEGTNYDGNAQEIDVLQKQQFIQQKPQTSIDCPYRLLTNHWLTLSRPQYQRTCGISSLVSIWNYQFSKLGLGNKEPISIEQAMLKLNIIGNDSIQEKMRKKFKKTAELTQNIQSTKKNQNTDELPEAQLSNNTKSLFEYINSVDFGCFTGNDTLLRWYRLLCRIYGGCGRSFIFYKVNSARSLYQNEKQAKKNLVQGLNSCGKLCFIYHAHDHYFCPVGYQYIPSQTNKNGNLFPSKELSQQQSGQLWIMVGQSSKMFPCLHNLRWSEMQTDLSTFYPKFYNIRRRDQGIQHYKNKQNQQQKNSTINCIMAFEKIKD